MPNSPVLWVAAGMLWVLDASINVAMQPYRAYVGDMLPPAQINKGFAMQSFFIGTGSVVASALPFLMTNLLNIPNTAPEGIIPPSVKFSFYVGAAIFFITVLWTVVMSKEYTPQELKEFAEAEKAGSTAISEEKEKILPSKKFLHKGIWWASIGFLLTLLLYYANVQSGAWQIELRPELYVFTLGLLLFGLIQLITGWLVSKNKKENGFVIFLNDVYNMPKTMGQLAIVQFFSWFALFSMWIYTTPAVTRHIYGTSDVTSALYNEGADWVSLMFAVYNGFAALVAFLLPVMANLTSRKATHMISLFLGGLGLLSVYFFKSPYLLIISMAGIGLAWASILSMPYAMIIGSLPHNKMGTYMSIFNLFIVIPQILAATLLGFFVKSIAGGEAIYALVLGGFSLIIAGILVNFVDDLHEVKN